MLNDCVTMCMTPLLYSKGDWQPSGRTCNGGVLNCSLLLVKVHVHFATGCTTGCVYNRLYHRL